jgi:hypothetical protein
MGRWWLLLGHWCCGSCAATRSWGRRRGCKRTRTRSRRPSRIVSRHRILPRFLFAGPRRSVVGVTQDSTTPAALRGESEFWQPNIEASSRPSPTVVTLAFGSKGVRPQAVRIGYNCLVVDIERSTTFTTIIGIARRAQARELSGASRRRYTVSERRPGWPESGPLGRPEGRSASHRDTFISEMIELAGKTSSARPCNYPRSG